MRSAFQAVKKLLLFSFFLIAFSGLWAQYTFVLETDSDHYVPFQPIEITITFTNTSDDTLEFTMPNMPSTYYYINDELFWYPCYCAITPLTILPGDSEVFSTVHYDGLVQGDYEIWVAYRLWIIPISKGNRLISWSTLQMAVKMW